MNKETRKLVLHFQLTNETSDRRWHIDIRSQLNVKQFRSEYDYSLNEEDIYISTPTSSPSRFMNLVRPTYQQVKNKVDMCRCSTIIRKDHPSWSLPSVMSSDHIFCSLLILLTDSRYIFCLMFPVLARTRLDPKFPIVLQNFWYLWNVNA